jgi:hypothetical protein
MATTQLSKLGYDAAWPALPSKGSTESSLTFEEPFGSTFNLTRKPNHSFRVLDPPFEIRRQIYHELLISKQGDGKIRNYSWAWPTFRRPDQFGVYPQILSTSKQVYDEASVILYKENEFCTNAPFDFFMYDMNMMKAHNVALINSFCLEVTKPFCPIGEDLQSTNLSCILKDLVGLQSWTLQKKRPDPYSQHQLLNYIFRFAARLDGIKRFTENRNSPILALKMIPKVDVLQMVSIYTTASFSRSGELKESDTAPAKL